MMRQDMLRLKERGTVDMEIQFENKRGILRFFGGGSAGDWHILEVEGLGLPPLNVQTITYYGENGQETVNKRLSGRTITMTVEVKGKDRNERAAIVSKALKILALDGVLSVRTFRERVADCYLKSCTEGARDGNFRKYVLQFVCDSPYFRDKEATEISLFKRADLLTDGFIIGEGVVLTNRIAGGKISNNSDERIRGVITLASGSNTESVSVINKTVGAVLKLNVEAEKLYTIDLDSRTITDADGSDCLGILDENCFMSDFYLEEGINEIEVTADEGTASDMSMIYSFYKLYTEATD